MATFQVVYDDFSGGQYMGMRPANQPKNTWNGNNVITNANGELIPVGTQTCATYAGVASTTGQLLGHFHNTFNAQVFVLHNTTHRMISYEHGNGTAFPVTPIVDTLTGQPTSVVSYSSLSGLYYYGALVSGSYRINSVDVNGTQSFITFTGGSVNVTQILAYKYRLLVVGTSSNRLYYSSANTGSGYGSSINVANYYEFNSRIIQIYARTEDLLILCSDGIYSMTGVPGASVNIQQLATSEAVDFGMANGVVKNRSLLYLDLGTDGRLYQFSGITSQPIASFEYGDYPFSDTTGSAFGSPSLTTNSRLVVQFSSGVTYFESAPGVFGKADVWSTPTTGSSLVSKPTGGDCRDEYILTAVMDTANSAAPVTMYRTIINTAGPLKLDARFRGSGTPTVNPTGTVKLSEYWHNKPFTVKEVFIEYSITTGGSVSCTILPTGVVDVPAANLASVASTAASETSPPAGDYRMFRYWPNNAAKGFGVIPELTITNCFVKRVILNCED